MDENESIEGLRQVKETFDQHNILYWLHAGTLLGAIRNGKIIPWDHDIDLATWETEIHKITNAFDDLRDKGFEIYYTGKKPHIFLFKKNCKIDIAIFKLNGDKATKSTYVHDQKNFGKIIDYILWVLELNNVYVKESAVPVFITKKLENICMLLPTVSRKKLVNILQMVYRRFASMHVEVIIPSHYFTNLSEIEFYGIKFKIPDEKEKYLVYRYGKNWRIPRKNWITSRDDGAVKREN